MGPESSFSLTRQAQTNRNDRPTYPRQTKTTQAAAKNQDARIVCRIVCRIDYQRTIHVGQQQSSSSLLVMPATLALGGVCAGVALLLAVRGGMDIATSRPASTLWDVFVEAALTFGWTVVCSGMVWLVPMDLPVGFALALPPATGWYAARFPRATYVHAHTLWGHCTWSPRCCRHSEPTRIAELTA
jgi:hypothetical protein